MRIWWVLLLVPLAAAQEPGPDVVVLVHHPYPDDADPLGFAFGDDCTGACDAFVVRHGHRAPFDDGIAFPGFITDGLHPMESLPGDFTATVEAYDAAVQERLAVETPVAIAVATRVVDDEVRVSSWWGTQSQLGPGLVAWVALVEDPVHYRPPPALSNGVFEHPFTVRHIEQLGPLVPTVGGEERRDLVIGLQDWDAERVRIAMWLEQTGSLGTFETGEVVQAVSHPIMREGITRQTERAVLVEAYSASWCDPCLIGDEALEEIAQMHGLPTGRALVDARSTYLREPTMPPAFIAIAAAAGFALFALSRMGGRP